MTVSHVSPQALKYVLGSGAWADHSKAGVMWAIQSLSWLDHLRTVHRTTSRDQQDTQSSRRPLTLGNPE